MSNVISNVTDTDSWQWHDSDKDTDIENDTYIYDDNDISDDIDIEIFDDIDTDNDIYIDNDVSDIDDMTLTWHWNVSVMSSPKWHRNVMSFSMTLTSSKHWSGEYRSDFFVRKFDQIRIPRVRKRSYTNN